MVEEKEEQAGDGDEEAAEEVEEEDEEADGDSLSGEGRPDRYGDGKSCSMSDSD